MSKDAAVPLPTVSKDAEEEPLSTREKIHQILGDSFEIFALTASLLIINGICVDVAIDVFENILKTIETPTQKE